MVGEQPLEVAVLEDQDEQTEHRAQAERVHDHRLDRQDHRAGHQEQDDQRRRHDDREHRGQVHGEAVLEVDVRRGLARHAEVERGVQRAHVVDELLAGVGQRRPGRRDGDQRQIRARGLCRSDRGHVCEAGPARVLEGVDAGTPAGAPTTRSSGALRLGGNRVLSASFTWRADAAVGSTPASTEVNLTWV